MWTSRLRRPEAAALGLLLAALIAAPLMAWPQAPAPTKATPLGSPATPLRSGHADMSAATRAMQDDDSQNPGMLWVAEGDSLWRARPRAGSKSCLDCHGEAPVSMRGVAARYPAIDRTSGQAINLGQRINQCRAQHQGGEPWAPDRRERLALEALLGSVSRGTRIEPPADARLQAAAQRGQALFERRIGQLDLSCAQCHNNLAGGRLAGSTIVQGHPNGYPLYRLEWQTLGSLQRRLRGCLNGVRAEPLPWDSDAVVELEAYLMQRARGLPIETPAVRP